MVDGIREQYTSEERMDEAKEGVSFHGATSGKLCFLRDRLFLHGNFSSPIVNLSATVKRVLSGT